jgi:UDP-N-acetylglucosamine 3-dehydrogenase
VIKVGVLGFGVMGRNHARVLNSMDGVQFVGYFDEFYKGSDESGIQRHRHLNSLLELDLDYCVISTPTIAHLKCVIECVDAGVNFLLEKPVALSVKEANEINRITKMSKVKSCVGHIERFNPAISQLKKRLRDGALGEIFTITTNRQGPYPKRVGDVGVALDLATHDIDLVRWILESEYASIYAVTKNRLSELHEDSILAVGISENNVGINHNVNWISPNKIRTVEVLGAKGKFVADLLSADLTFYENGEHIVAHDAIAHFSGVSVGDITRLSFDKKEPLLSEHIAFQKYLFGGKNEVVSIKDGTRNMLVSEAILKSAQINQKVALF